MYLNCNKSRCLRITNLPLMLKLKKYQLLTHKIKYKSYIQLNTIKIMKILKYLALPKNKVVKNNINQE